MLTLDWPWALLLLPLPYLIYKFAPRAEQQSNALLVPFYARVEQLQQADTGTHQRRIWRVVLLSIIWALLVAAVAKPLWHGDPVTLPASGRDLLLAVDISGSMETADMQWQGEQFQRLTAVKSVVGDFVERRQSDRLGLILFGSRAYLQAPLTFDRTTIKQLLHEAQVGFAGEKTAIGDAIGLAVKRLRDRPQESRVLILLTDGDNTAGQLSPIQAAELAQTAGVKVYTVGVGADVMRVKGLFGTRRVNPSADLDETTLTAIAQQTGGQYFRAKNPEDLALIYSELDKLEPIEQEAETFRPVKSLFYWPLAGAVILTLLMAALQLASCLLNALFSSQKEADDA